MLAESHCEVSASRSSIGICCRARYTDHGADIEQRLEAAVRSLILRHALNSTLLDLELSGEALRLCVKAVAILKGFARDSSVCVDVGRPLVIGNVAHASLGGVFLEVLRSVAHGGRRIARQLLLLMWFAWPELCLEHGLIQVCRVCWQDNSRSGDERVSVTEQTERSEYKKTIEKRRSPTTDELTRRSIAVQISVLSVHTTH